ncbi:MAG: hypothetical protein JWO08_2733 [Verrucomicrobiaceae bacterium]|nr:hypothetical protein [Verrucomicrobiaceae bacterium]
MRFLLPLLLVLTFSTAQAFEIATFSVDVTPPVGHACMGGGILPVRSVKEPLQARGFVLFGAEKPFVVVSFDWCEIRGVAYDDWRAALAEVVGSEPERIIISSTHVHDAPVMDPEAEYLLRDAERSGAWKDLEPVHAKEKIQIASVCWPDFNRLCIQRAKLALNHALTTRRTITHFGTGRAKVDGIASNRRFIKPDGTISYGRMSRCTDPVAKAADDGDIDPWLRTLSFWDGDQMVCTLHSYATHPMSSYGNGEVSIDFVGLAREQLQKEMPGTFHIYASGCAGNVTAGKYNDGSPKAREDLTRKLHTAMVAAVAATQKQEIKTMAFRLAKIPLGARNTIGFTEDELRYRLTHEVRAYGRAEPAMGLSWYQRVKSGHQVDLPLIDFGSAQLMLLPAESYVEYQLFSQSLKPDSFVMVMGYGECGPGYIPIERAWMEHDSNLRDWTWVGPDSQPIMEKAIREVLK